MTTKVCQPRPIETLAGVEPTTDKTALSTRHYISADKIRFEGGVPKVIGGWESIDFTNSVTISGKARSVYSTVLSSEVYTLIGTHEKLYNLSGSELTNITPVKTSTIAVANSLATLYGTLANNPVTTVNGSKTVTIADTSAARFKAGDTVTLSGASTTNGVPDTELNAAHLIRSVGVNSYTVTVSTAATSSGSGGGASVVRASGHINVTKAAHGMANGDRVKILAAADTGGITAAQINLEFIIRNKDTNTFDVVTAGTSTSSVSSAGGASTTYQEEIADGLEDEAFGQGYGVGLYGVGLYGVALQSTGRDFPRIWYFDNFGETVIMTPGEQTGLYEWDGSTSAAPVLVTNAPTAINYAFISNNIVVTFGKSDIGNRIATSDQGALTTWTGSSTNQVFEDDIEGAGKLISHVQAAGLNLIFTEQQTYTFRYIGLPNVWEVKIKDPAIGIIAPMARVVANGIAYWMGANNFYMWRGGNIEIIPANSQFQSTILRYVFENLNIAQKSKIFAWHNEAYNEVWFHYPSEASDEPDRVARVNLADFTWSPDTFDRTAAEYPNINLDFPRLVSSDGTLYFHEYGKNADGAALNWSLQTNTKMLGKNVSAIVGIIPDSIQDGSITFNITAKQFPQSATSTYNQDYTVTSTTERVPAAISGRFWNYTFSGGEVDKTWQLGQWFEEIQPTGGN